MRLPVPFVFVLGPPGSGKGTQCSLICEKFSSVLHLTAGAIHIPPILWAQRVLGTADQPWRGLATRKLCASVYEYMLVWVRFLDWSALSRAVVLYTSIVCVSHIFVRSICACYRRPAEEVYTRR